MGHADQAQQRRGPHQGLRSVRRDGQGSGGGDSNHECQRQTSDHRDCDQETFVGKYLICAFIRLAYIHRETLLLGHIPY